MKNSKTFHHALQTKALLSKKHNFKLNVFSLERESELQNYFSPLFKLTTGECVVFTKHFQSDSTAFSKCSANL